LLSKEELALFNQKLGSNIRTARLKKEIKQDDLATRLGFKSRISVVNIENGKQNVQLTTLIEIADYLKESMNDLIPPLQTIKKGLSPSLIKKIGKEIVNDPDSFEKAENFFRLTSSKK
jgi:transcriptional regulator with XRE-family HTH domain